MDKKKPEYPRPARPGKLPEGEWKATKHSREGRTVVTVGDEHVVNIDDEAVGAAMVESFNAGVRLAQLKEAAAKDDGSVIFPIDGDELVNDGSAKLMLQRDVGLGPQVFGISAVDDGGFSMVLCTPECWETMRSKVDEYVAAIKNKKEN